MMKNLLSSNELTKDKMAEASNTPTDCGEKSRTIKRRFGVRKMYIAALSAMFLALPFGLATGYSAPATYDMTHRASSSIKPTDDEISWIGSILPLGIMVGGILAGPLADRIGRKDILISTIIPSGLGWLIICYAKTALMVILGRFICGVSYGIITVAVPMYCVEISTAEVRGLLGSSFQGSFTVGYLLSVTIGTYVSWEYLALNGLIFSIFGITCFCFMPESPRWLLAKGRLTDAICVMHELQGGFVDAEKECNTIYKDMESQPKGKLSLREFKDPTVLKPTLLGLTLVFFRQFSGAASIYYYSSQIFEITKDFINPKKATIVIGAVQVVATLSSNIIVDKTGRRALLILSGALIALTLATLGTYYYMSSTDTYFQNKYSWIPLVSLILFDTAYSIGYGPISFLLVAEMLPVRARSTVSGLISFANGFFSFTVAKTFSWLEIVLNTYGAFWFYSSISILGIIFLVYKVPETKGKILEDIEKLFRSPKPIKQSVNIAVIA